MRMRHLRTGTATIAKMAAPVPVFTANAHAQCLLLCFGGICSSLAATPTGPAHTLQDPRCVLVGLVWTDRLIDSFQCVR